LNDRFRKTKFRYSIYQDTSRKVKCFKYRYFISHFRKVTSTGKPGRTGSDNRYFMTIRSWFFDFCRRQGVVIISDKSFQSADSDRFSFYTANTIFFTLIFLGTDSSANSWERTGLINYLICALVVFFRYFFYKFRYIDVNGTTIDTRFMFAIETSCGFVQGNFFGIS